MKFPLLSLLSSLVLLGCVLIGADVHLYSVSVEIGEEISIHPIFWAELSEEQMYTIGCHGFCVGNVVATIREGEGAYQDVQPRGAIDCVLPHELVHTEQWRALGMWHLVAWVVLPLEPPGIYNWACPATFVNGMWKPPEGWENQWSFITFGR